MADEGGEEITLGELLDMLKEETLRAVHVAIACRVEKYNKAKGTVDVTPMLNRHLPDGQGNYVAEALPKLSDIPVQFYRVGQFEFTFPIAVGDFGKIVICDKNLAQWRATGAQGDPGDLGNHTLDGAVFEPGLYPDATPPKNPDDNNMVIGSTSDGASRIEIKPSGGGNLGAGATKGIAREGDDLTANAKITTWAKAVETALNTAGSAILPASSWDTLGNGAAGALGAVHGASGKWKAVD